MVLSEAIPIDIKDRQGVSAPAKHHSQTLGHPVYKITMICVIIHVR